ncbi:MAG: VWA domain-containing protein [Chloroflexi bacterium]|nr:VWA domain-containing protein [Chloroflexota bacterium]
MIKQRIQKLVHKTERGQAIILVAFAIIGLVAMVGLVTDTGILLIEYGKLKRGVDAAAVAAAQQFRLPTSGATEIDKVALENAARNFLQLNQSSDITSVIVHSCEDNPADTFTDVDSSGVWEEGEPLIQDWDSDGEYDASERPVLCNPDPTDLKNNRKLVEVIASKNIYFGFLRVIGIESTTVTASSTGEAATIDLVLVIDTSASMAFQTDGIDERSEGDDPKVCNSDDTCQPMKAVKDVALDFIDTLYLDYDRVAIVTMTSQRPDKDRHPRLLLPLTSSKAEVINAINGITVFEPRVCDPSNPDIPGTCIKYAGGVYDPVNDVNIGGIFQNADYCDIWQEHNFEATADPSSCPSSNIGGALKLARSAFIDPDPDYTGRLDAFWVVVNLFGGPANATDANNAPISDTDSTPKYPYGYCPRYTWTYKWLDVGGGFCRDMLPSTRHHDTDPLEPYINPVTEVVDPYSPISHYDADDYARDMADSLATLISGEGVTIFTIGLGAQVQRTNTSAEYYPSPNETTKIAPAEALFQYIAECAGEGVDVITYVSPTNHHCKPDPTTLVINHGQYFYAPSTDALREIFDRIAKNIATKISQ